MAKITIDGKEYEVEGGDNLLHAALSKGLDIPYFCWHPALGSVGACRQCAVKQYKDENDTQGKLVMSCMTPCGSASRYSINDPESKQFRASVIEWLMTNHPHDCPVCEEGGHCHLQDMTVMTGHTRRRYRFDKRTHRNQDLGPFIGHEMNRCISCYRCVRYYKDYAGGTDLDVFGAASNVFFGRAEDGTLESEFSGNLTEVCPTGVFTDKTHSERYTRKWDMQFAPSICSGCAVGCSISPGERYGEIRRIENRYHGELNGYFICDRGRFGYGYTNLKERPRRALLRRGGALIEAPRGEAISEVASLLRDKKVLGIGSPRASLEANFALRQWVGEQNFSTGMGAADQQATQLIIEVLRDHPVPVATIAEMEEADAVIVLGEDPTQTAARFALAIRQAARGKGAAMAEQRHIATWQAESVKDCGQRAKHPVVILSPAATRLDDITALSERLAPEQVAATAAAIAHAFDERAPKPNLDNARQALVQRVVDIFKQATRPLIVTGGASGVAVIQAAANLARSLHQAGTQVKLALAPAETNSIGVGLMGGADVEALLAHVDSNSVLVVLENDLFRRAPQGVVNAALQKCAALVVLEHTQTATAGLAHVVLPAATVFESDGSFINYEGRAQRHLQVFDPVVYDRSVAVQESWRWLAALSQVGWKTFDEVCTACASAVPALQKMTEIAPSAKFRVRGLRMARAPHRQSGRTAQRAHLSVHEPRASQDADTALNFSMEGYSGPAEPTPLIPFVWAPSWNSPQAWNKFQDEVGGSLRGGDPGIRLLASGGGGGYFTLLMDEKPAPGKLRVLALPDLFLSDELAARAPPVQARATQPQLQLHPDDAKFYGLVTGDQASFQLGGAFVTLPVQMNSNWPMGFAGVPAGVKGCPFMPAHADIRPEPAEIEV